jgi:alkylation response protein AidB-like acyl-CoA dehydrogenase
MNFDFNGEQYMLRDSVRDLLGAKWSTEQLRAHVRGDGIDSDLWRGLVELGLTTLLVPEAHGGMSMTLLDLVLVLEEFGRALVTGPIVETLLASEILARHGTAEQQSRILPSVAAGTMRLALAHLEPEATYATGDVHLRATRSAGGWRLSGRKILVPYAHAVDQLLVAARADDDSPALFLCDPRAQGVTVRPNVIVDPTYRMCEVVLDDVPVPAADVLGGAPGAALGRLIDTSTLAAAAQMTGIAARALEVAVAYAKERVQFGKPIGSFQAIKHKCADMAVLVDTSRSAVYYAGWTLAQDDEPAAKAVSMAKAYCGDACRTVCNESLQIHGGIGFTWEHDLHLYLKRGKLLEYTFGDATWHREQVAAAVLAGPRATAGVA